MKKILITLFSIFLFGCKIEPKKINYGYDDCDQCRMKIIDKIHGAELVTKKGKVLKFDAIECMVRYLKRNSTENIELFLVNIYTEPEILLDAKEVTYLISENVPSPMGGYLSAFRNKEEAENLKLEKGGELYKWEELLLVFEK